MFIRNTKFVLYGPFNTIEATPENIMNTYKELTTTGLQLLPGTFQELNPLMGVNPVDRIMFNNNSENLTIQISRESLEITKWSVVDKIYKFSDENIDLNKKIKAIVNALIKSNSLFNLGTRIALVYHTLYDKDKIFPLDKIYEEMNNRFPGYNSEETFEWSTRSVKRGSLNISGNEELLNIVTEVLKSGGQFTLNGKSQEFDTVQSRFDINTLLPNNKQRINYDFVVEFINEVNEKFSSHCSEIEAKIIEPSRD